MKRPNRYPYTKNQWEEEAVDYFTSHILKNRLTREIKNAEVE